MKRPCYWESATDNYQLTHYTQRFKSAVHLAYNLARHPFPPQVSMILIKSTFVLSEKLWLALTAYVYCSLFSLFLGRIRVDLDVLCVCCV
jgi:hypothetical protein